VDGGKTLAIRSDSPRYLLCGIRWTPQALFESRLASQWRERARHWLANPLFSQDVGGAFARRNYLEQLFNRLAWSEQAEVRREAVVGQARVMYWLAAENHEPAEIERTRQLFDGAFKVAGEDPLLRQTISASCLDLNDPSGRVPKGPFCQAVAPIPWEAPLTPPPEGAPAWAVEQRKLAARMEMITRWWVEKRQQPNGELGGGWGDDVEILRYWGPQALGLGSAVAVRGIRKLADGLWSSGILLDGYDRQISDVEHSSEPTTDTQPLLAACDPDDPEPRARLAATAACARNWIGKQPDGKWRFRGAWFNCRQFDQRPERAIDVHLNTRAMGPALWHSYLTREPASIQLLVKWAASWTQAMRATRFGKPAGMFPPAMKSSDGSYLVASQWWDKPNAEWDYFQWSGAAQESLASLLLAVHDLTGDPRWLMAAGESFQILDHCSWAAKFCDQITQAPEAFYEWRSRTGNSRYDKAFGYLPGQAPAAVLSKMAAQAREVEARWAVNFDMFTSEALYTDRVYYRLPPGYRRRLFGGEAPRGDRFPSFAVTWPATEGQFARAVLEASPIAMVLQAYSFEAREITIPVRVWRLQPGPYRWESRDRKGAPVGQGAVTLGGRAQVIKLPLPSQSEVTITIRRGESL